ncbi:hypothetical protein Q9251_11060 [Alkalihalobacillus macyae]|uniref:hypothetical protein n=1 Tax=Guptibacillus hwajinpoensis TaxID=208199 RepID=UPI00273BC97A|nr:hypothetical protein [Alkalihalobacillus macyae]MDP4551420.1 hypothetical protein [Alkalihalobacillus macyae]
MNNSVAGLLLIGFSLLTAVVAYGFDQLSNAVKKSAGFINNGGSIAYRDPIVPQIPIILILITVLIGVYIIIKK